MVSVVQAASGLNISGIDRAYPADLSFKRRKDNTHQTAFGCVNKEINLQKPDRVIISIKSFSHRELNQTELLTYSLQIHQKFSEIFPCFHFQFFAQPVPGSFYTVGRYAHDGSGFFNREVQLCQCGQS